MAQTNPSSQQPNRPEKSIEITLKDDKDKLDHILQALTGENPRQITETALDEFIDDLNAINTRTEELRSKEPKYFISIDVLNELQNNVRDVADNLALAADALRGEGSLKDKQEFFYPQISESLPLLRSALKQFQLSKMDSLSQTNSSSQQPIGPEKLKEDEDKLDQILQQLMNKNPRKITEPDLDKFITNLLAINARAEKFRNKEPKYFISIDALQKNIRDAADNLALAADVLRGGGNLKDKKEVFFPKIRESLPLLRNALKQFQLPKMDDLSQQGGIA